MLARRVGRALGGGRPPKRADPRQGNAVLDRCTTFLTIALATKSCSYSSRSKRGQPACLHDCTGAKYEKKDRPGQARPTRKEGGRKRERQRQRQRQREVCLAGYLCARLANGQPGR